MTLSDRITDLTDRIAAEFNSVRLVAKTIIGQGGITVTDDTVNKRWVIDFPTLNEVIQDQIGAHVKPGTNVTVVYDDPSGDTTISSSGGGGGSAAINDITPSGTTTYSSNKTEAVVASAVNTLATSGLVVWQNATDTSRKSVPSGGLLVIVGGSAPPSWMLAGDVQLAVS